MPVEAQPSGEVALTKGREWGAGVTAEVGMFSSIGARLKSVVFDPSRIREPPFPHKSSIFGHLEAQHAGRSLSKGGDGAGVVLDRDEDSVNKGEGAGRGVLTCNKDGSVIEEGGEVDKVILFMAKMGEPGKVFRGHIEVDAQGVKSQRVAPILSPVFVDEGTRAL